MIDSSNQIGRLLKGFPCFFFPVLLLSSIGKETALNHVMSSGLAGDGFGATREMSLRKLIWVVTRIRIQVDKYSRWCGSFLGRNPAICSGNVSDFEL